MVDLSPQWAHMREEFRKLVREELSYLRADFRMDVRQELLCSAHARLAETDKTNCSPHTKVSNGAVSNEPLRRLARSSEMEETIPTLPGEVDDVFPPTDYPTGLAVEEIQKNATQASTTSKDGSKRFRKRRARKPRLQQAMGLVPDIERNSVNYQGTPKKVEDMLQSRWFEYLSLTVIFANTVVIGLTIEHRAANLTQDTPTVYLVLDICFFLYFLAEIVLRLVAFHRHFFSIFGWGWNAFDLGLLIFQFVDQVLMLVDLERTEGAGSFVGLRIGRVLRAVRCMRMMKLTLYANNLRLLVSCIVHCFSSFFWAAVFLSLLIYIFGLYLTDSLVGIRIDLGQGREDDFGLADNFGSVPRTCLSLLQALTGGMDWDVLFRALSEVSDWLAWLFILYILFGFLALMNLVTALFVNAAIDRAHAVDDTNRLFQAHKLFAALDEDGSNGISEHELMEHINDDAVQEFLNCVDMDREEVHLLFSILDRDGGGSIDFEEFVNGLLRIHGTASSRDLLMMSHEVRSSLSDFQSRLKHNY